MTEPVAIDTGPIVAVLSVDDAHHKACSEFLQKLRRPPVTTWPILTEAAWLLRRAPNGIGRLCALVRSGAMEIHELDGAALDWLPRFAEKYKDLTPQLADASLVYAAERRGIRTIFTLDRRDFSVFRATSGQAFLLVPEPESA